MECMKGFIPNNFDYLSNMPHVKTTGTVFVDTRVLNEMHEYIENTDRNGVCPRNVLAKKVDDSNYPVLDQ